MKSDLERMDREDGQDAIAWLLRVDSPDATEADWLALQAWLEASPDNRAAYDRAERISTELQCAAPALLSAMDARPQPAQPRRPLSARRTSSRMTRRAFGGMAAAAAAATIAVFISTRPAAPPPAEVFQTAKGETREITLSDGSRVHLNSASRVSVRFEKARRNVELVEGEAAFDVAHDTTRPFVIAAGEKDIRVVGTEFDVLRHRGALRVTVRRGVVAVQAPGEAASRAEPIVLRAGDQLDHRADTRLWTVAKVDPENAFSWKRGDLVYSDRTLEEVVTDLNRYFETPMQVAGPAAQLRFSGVLKLEDQQSVLRHIEAFLPVAAERVGDGVVLRMADARG